jgi:cobalt-zinc-cadmium efflux system outer membrane protein
MIHAVLSCLRHVHRHTVAFTAAACLFATDGASGQEPGGAVALVNPANPSPLEQLPAPASQPPGGLTLEVLEGMALLGNPALVRATAEVGAARGNWVQVGLKPNPTVGYEGQQIGSGGLAEQHGVSFGQEIVTGGKLRLNRAIARGDIEIVERELSALRLRVLTDVRMAYFQILIAQRQIALADELIRVSQEGAKVADALLNAKQVGRVDVLQAKLEGDQAQLNKQSALNRLDAAWRELAAIVGNPALGYQPLVGDPAAAPCDAQYDVLLSRLLSQSPEIAAAAANLDRARAALARARVQPIPNITFQGVVNWQDNGIDGKPDGAIGASVPLPLFDRNQGNIMRAEREVAAAQQAIAQLELDLQQRLAPVFERFLNAQQQALKYRDSILPTAEESLKLTRHMYEAGEINYTGLLTVQRTFALANRDYLDAVLRLRLAEAELGGMLLSGSLQSRSATRAIQP